MLRILTGLEAYRTSSPCAPVRVVCQFKAASSGGIVPPASMMLAQLFLAAATVAVPAIVAPPDDPNFRDCLDPRHGVRLEWQLPDDGTRTYVLVKRWVPEINAWKPWLTTREARPPFTLEMQSPAAHNSEFAWLVFAVKGEDMEHTDWQFFCTTEDRGAPDVAGADGRAGSDGDAGRQRLVFMAHERSG